MNTKPVGSIHHVCIQTSNFEEAYRFYTEALGLSVIKPPYDFKTRRITLLNAGSIEIELNTLKKGTENQSQQYSEFGIGPSHIAFVVENLDVALDHLRLHSVAIHKEPFIPPTGDPKQPRVAFIVGPDGDHIELREPEYK